MFPCISFTAGFSCSWRGRIFVGHLGHKEHLTEDNMEYFAVKRDKREFDVLEGKQWSDWSHLKAGKHSVYVADGKQLPHRVLRTLVAAIDPKKDVQLIQIQ